MGTGVAWLNSNSMNQSFGARLRQQREKREISLKAISDQTKIKLSLLEGLERDDISQWPSGIFRRAYVRSYAKAIGLNPDVVVHEFFELYPEPKEAEPPPPPPPTLRSLVGSALGTLSLRRKPAEETWQPQELALNLPPTASHARVVNVEPEPEATSGRVLNVEPPVSLPVAPEPEPTARDLDLLAAAHICTELGRVEDPGQVQALLRDAARILDAQGLIVWVWDALSAELKPALVHGYPDSVRARIPGVRADADNVTAAAFRSASTCSVTGDDHSSGALVVPLLRPATCAGVLAIELPRGNEKLPAVRAVATFLAAMLAQLVGVAGVSDDALPAPAEASQHA
jgi:transcriptional regulator with XRE-family HTH domain